MPTTSSGLAPLQSGRCCRDPRACACWRSAGCPGRRSMRGPRSEAVVGSRPVATTEETAKGAGEEAGGPVHGGRLVARTLASRGVSHLFTLSGGHLFSIYDGCKAEGIEVVDTRHEQSAAFAAIGWAKATREPGICALTAGCGVTNGMSAIASAQADGVPLVTLGGRAPEMRWGMGSLQEIDHVPFVGPLVKSAHTVKDPAKIALTTAAAIDIA